MRKIFSFLTALLFVGSLWGGEAQHLSTSVTLSGGSHDGSKITWSEVSDNITVQQLQGTSGTAVNASYIAAPRVYKGHILAFSAASGYIIDTVIITCNGSYYGNSMTAGIAISSNVVTNNTTAIGRSFYYTNSAKDTLINKAGASTFYLQNVASATNTQLRPSAIKICYTKEATNEPTITAGDVAFGTFVPGISGTKNLSVEGENLSAAITPSFKEGTNFSIASGSLTAEGGTLTLSVIAEEDGDYTDSLFLTSGTLVKGVKISAKVVNTTGEGTSAKPFTVTDIKKLNNGLLGNYWVKGYILRGFDGTKINDTSDAGLLLAEKMSSPDDTISVQLPTGTIRTALNVPSNSSKGWLVKVEGSLEAYGVYKGVKSLTDYAIIPEPRITVKNNASETIEAMAFGNVGQRWQQSFVFGFSYENLEAGDLTMTIGGTDAEAFAFSGDESTETVNITSASGSVTSLSFHQATQTAGTYNAKLTFSGCGLTPVEIPITMTVKEPEFSVSTSSIDFGEVRQHSKATTTFTLTGRYLSGDYSVKIGAFGAVFDVLSEAETYYIWPNSDGEIDETVTVICDATNVYSAGALTQSHLILQSTANVEEFDDIENLITFDGTVIATYGIQIVSENGYVSVNSSAPTTDTTVYVVDENEAITLVATPEVGYEFVNWTYDDNKVLLSTDDDVATTTAYAYEADIITANFQAQSCTNLAKPTLDAITKDYKSATIAWNAVTHAEGYLLNITKHSDASAVLTDSIIVAPAVSCEITGLDAETQYDFTVMALGDGTEYCDESNPLLEGSFTTDDYPVATLALIENGDTVDFAGDHQLKDVVALPTTVTTGCQDKVFVGWDSHSNCSTAPAYAKGANYTLESIADTLYAVYATETPGSNQTYTLDYTVDEIGDLSLGYGNAVNVTASDGSAWVVKAAKQTGMQINAKKNSSIKIPNCPGNIVSIALTCNSGAKNAVGFSADDYTGGSIDDVDYIVYSSENSESQTLSFTGKSVKAGYIVPKAGNCQITNIVVTYASAPTYSNYTTTGPKPIPTALDNTDANVKAVKVMREGQIFILRGDKTYTIQGQLVK